MARSKMAHKWTDDELRHLMELWAQDENVYVIADRLNTTAYAISKMVIRLRNNGVPLKRRTSGNVAGRRSKPWTQAEVEYLLRRRKDKATAEQIGVELGRTYNGVCGMINKLRNESVRVEMLGSGKRRLWSVEALLAQTVTEVRQAETIIAGNAPD